MAQIIKIALIKNIRAYTKKLVLPGFQGIALYDIIYIFRKEIKEDALSIRASSISFYFILALFPSIIFFFSLIPYIPIKNFNSFVLEFLSDILPNGIYVILESTIKDIVSIQRGGLTSINFLLAIFISSNGVNSIMKAFDKMNETFKTRTFLEKKKASLQIVFLINFQLILTIILIIKGEEFLRVLLKLLHTDSILTYYILKFVKTLLMVFTYFNAIALIYYFGPSVKNRYKYFSAGATFATFISLFFSYGFKIYTAYLNNFNRLYGSLGIIIVSMLWVYLNAMVLLFGFELNNSIELNKLKIKNNEEEDIL